MIRMSESTIILQFHFIYLLKQTLWAERAAANGSQSIRQIFYHFSSFFILVFPFRRMR